MTSNFVKTTKRSENTEYETKVKVSKHNRKAKRKNKRDLQEDKD